MLDINDLKRQGIVIKLDGVPYLVLKSQHARTAQRRAFVRTTLKNLITGQVIERNFNAGDKIEEAEVKKIKANFLYRTKDKFYFLDSENFEEIPINEKTLEGKEGFLKEGLEVLILYFENTPISVELPSKVALKVVVAPQAVKGDTTQGRVMKTVKLETGLEIEAPIFIKEGDIIVVNTEDGKYVERL